MGLKQFSACHQPKRILPICPNAIKPANYTADSFPTFLAACLTFACIINKCPEFDNKDHSSFFLKYNQFSLSQSHTGVQENQEKGVGGDELFAQRLFSGQRSSPAFTSQPASIFRSCDGPDPGG